MRGGAAGTAVEPQVPVFIRPSAWWHVDTGDSADARFLRGESFAAYWAATVLSTATVINRPSPTGQVYRLTAAAIAAMADRVIRLGSGQIVEVQHNKTKARPGDLEW